MKTLILLLAASVAVTDFSSAVLFLSGASSVEELDSSELERYTALQAHPLDLNAASQARLASCSLFSAWQAASIADYRSRSGDILSFAELASVPGIGEGMAAALRHFVILRSSRPAGRRSSDSVRVGATARLSGSGPDAASVTLTPSFKAEVLLGESAAASLSFKGDAFTSWSVECYGRGLLQKLTLGHFNLRFGQGLLLWTGFSLSGVPTVVSFARNPSLASAANSYSGGGFTGVAASIGTPLPGRNSAGSNVLTLFAADGGVAGANFLHLWRSAQASVSAMCRGEDWGASADFRLGRSGILLFGEAALWSQSESISPSALIGVVWSPQYGVKYALLGRAYHPQYSAPAGAVRSSTRVSDELGASVGVRLRSLDLTADAAFHPSKGSSQFKSVLCWTAECGALRPSVRICERWTPGSAQAWRHDARADLAFDSGPCTFEGRVNLVNSLSTSFLCYAGVLYRGAASPGSRSKPLSAWLRFELFLVDNWADRIYVYERDAPGNFNVPACYGRGCRVSAMLSWRGLYLRAGRSWYPWTEKAPKTEVRVQYVLNL